MKNQNFSGNIHTWITFLVVLCAAGSVSAQINSATHTRGKLWETLYNWGFIGDPGAWDYGENTGIGFYPGFSGYTFPTDEEQANGFITNVNFHNFRTGPWVIVKGALTPVPPDYSPAFKPFLLYHASLTTNDNGVLNNIPPFQRIQNYIGSENFNPLIPEEINIISFHTATGVTVTQRSMAWGYPGYSDFIIYDYIFKNTGQQAITSINKIIPVEQTLNEVWIVFHSGIQVSTKGVLNFHYNSDFLSSAAPAGGFGWHPGSGYTDYYAVENADEDGKGLLFYSRDYNGGREPVPWDNYGLKYNWQNLLRVKTEWLPELQDPAAFGFVFLYYTPPPGSNNNPFEPDPIHFNVYSDEGQKFKGKTVDFESFGTKAFSLQELYDFATHDFLPPETSNGKLYCWYTGSFGPYTLAPGDSVRLIVAEVAGMLDIHQVVMGDPDHWYPDSTIAAIRRNAEAARRALSWGIGSSSDGFQIIADVPEPPPPPNCVSVNVSYGADTAKIAVRWDRIAEEAQILDGSGLLFYDGSTDLSGYRIYRGSDKRGIWSLLIDIPRSELGTYWNEASGKYEYIDMDLQFGFEYNYYVQAYNSTPKSWVSANGSTVTNLGELVSGDLNRTLLTSASAGPVSIKNGWDVFVVPNPYVEGDLERSFGEPTPDKIEFRKLPERAVIKIFTISGDLVKTIIHEPDAQGNMSGTAKWDQRSDSGLRVAPGLYIYAIESRTEGSTGKKTTGKLMIIR